MARELPLLAVARMRAFRKRVHVSRSELPTEAERAEEADALPLAQGGFSYLLGRGVDKDVQRAASLYEQSAQDRSLLGMFGLDVVLVSGECVEMDMARGFSEVRSAVVSADDPQLLYRIARFHEEFSEEFSEEKALQPYRRSARAGHGLSEAILRERGAD